MLVVVVVVSWEAASANELGEGVVDDLGVHNAVETKDASTESTVMPPLEESKRFMTLETFGHLIVWQILELSVSGTIVRWEVVWMRRQRNVLLQPGHSVGHSIFFLCAQSLGKLLGLLYDFWNCENGAGQPGRAYSSRGHSLENNVSIKKKICLVGSTLGFGPQGSRHLILSERNAFSDQLPDQTPECRGESCCWRVESFVECCSWEKRTHWAQ